jgi:hypothetical protein
MTGASRIIAIGTGSADRAAEDEFLLTEDLARSEPVQTAFPDEDPAPRGRWQDWLFPALGFAAILAWSGFFVWANQARLLAPSAPADWSMWIAQWATPVLLVGVTWLLLMRTSRREAVRFADTSRQLASESANLETRLITVNRELSLAREFIGAQSRDLEALGRIASDRLSQNAQRLEGLIQANGARIEAIASVSSTALENMEKLRGQLPVIVSSAKDVTNNIGNAGRTAHAQIEKLVQGFNRLNEFGQASERQAERMKAEAEAVGAEFARQCALFEDTAQQRFAALSEQGVQFRTQLESHEVEALAAIRTRAAALAEEVTEARQALDQQEEDTLVSLRARLSALRDEGSSVARALREGEARAAEDWQAMVSGFNAQLDGIDERIAALHASQADRIASMAAHGESLSEKLAGFDRHITAIAGSTAASEAALTRSLEGIDASLDKGKTNLEGISASVETLTEDSVRLFELIHASAEQSRNELPQAIATGEDRLTALEARARALEEALRKSGEHSDALSGSVSGSHSSLQALSAEIAALQDRIAGNTVSHASLLADLRQSLERIDEESGRLSEKARGELSTALAELRDTARQTIADLGEANAPAIRKIASSLASESAAAIDQAMRSAATESAGRLEQAASHAAGLGREAAIQLRDQLAKVDELAGNLERRVSHAREKAEELVDNDFSKRAALITESLNSNAIDIAKALSSEVADTAWAAYLRGDRGIFTRRAVTLVSGGDARAICQTYENDREFRDHVRRYIHDFEAMLRQILSTRDGHALGVTILSSDMGKLYVALAQAIERLRA